MQRLPDALGKQIVPEYGKLILLHSIHFLHRRVYLYSVCMTVFWQIASQPAHKLHLVKSHSPLELYVTLMGGARGGRGDLIGGVEHIPCFQVNIVNLPV